MEIDIKESQDVEDILNDDTFEESSEEDVSSEPKTDKEKRQLEELRNEVRKQQQEVVRSKFARVDSKPEFASEIINSLSTQKVANLEDDQISELLEKRKFVNLLNNFGWQRLAKRVLDNVADVENYSLSKEGFLPRQVFTDTTKSAQYTYELKNKKKEKKEV